MQAASGMQLPGHHLISERLMNDYMTRTIACSSCNLKMCCPVQLAWCNCANSPVFNLDPGHVPIGRPWNAPVVINQAQAIVRPGGVKLQGVRPLHAQRCTSQYSVRPC